ncbi:MAG: hypothetical protein HZA22_10910 [Nitrospirae bacterium]|nr:hypothetical protein [Nitrospirota bacterium]MBI5696154.1 hypothetical protein [Nitrospirota bacterium]
MKRICEIYIRKSRLIGALYCIVPTCITYLIVIPTIPFREVYAIRLVLSVIVGGPLGALLNSYGVRLWLAKHASPAGPATALDGAVIGAGVGVGVGLIPPLTLLISSNHIENAKAAIIAVWLVSIFNGMVLGWAVGSIGAKNVGADEARGLLK